MGEAHTQSAVADMVNNAVDGATVLVPKVFLAFENGGFGYIVMEYIDGSDSTETESDIIKVAAAVQQLIGLHIPATNPPGPVGGGRITHRFFVQWRSAVVYGTVALLQEHINKVKYPASSNLRAMQRAAGYLVPFGRNDIYLHVPFDSSRPVNYDFFPYEMTGQFLMG
ncbi:hypothetical protein BD410DRAFT_897784 [Rickenella mellea]|uniref:Aminoglycoside phosphotransferase domain-containing protein n=1 Tax=Rickenella mellea TaxID=50990 RepID=A0A4Y7Q6Y3_9AGAM|nr:hypothetical protein BD410DRAFT_897784 [Rickenella mellea]